MENIDEILWEQAAARHDEALSCLLEGRNAEAEELARQASEELARAVGEDHPDSLNALATLAQALGLRGSLQESAALLERVWSQGMRWRGEPLADPVRWRAGLLLAEAWIRLARYGEARELLDAIEGELPPGEPTLREVWNLRGISAKFEGRWEEAERAYQRAVEGLGAPERAEMFHNLSGLATARGDFPAAEDWSRQALAARRDRRSRAYGMDLAGLGDALLGQGRAGEATRAYRRALRIFQALDARDPEIAYALHNLGDALAARGRGREAEAAYLDSLARKQEILGPDHPEIAGTLANLAVLYQEQGRLAEATQRLEEAWAKVEGLDEAHPVRLGVANLRG